MPSGTHWPARPSRFDPPRRPGARTRVRPVRGRMAAGGADAVPGRHRPHGRRAPRRGVGAGAVGAALCGRAAGGPAPVTRRAGRDLQLEGEDVALELRAGLTRGLRPAVLVVTERLGRVGAHRIPPEPHRGVATGRVTLRRVPRGRYPFTGATATVEDPFGL